MLQSALAPDVHAGSSGAPAPSGAPPGSTGPATASAGSIGTGSVVAPRPVILGFGNTLLRDDGAGVQLVMQLRRELGADAAEFVDGGTMSFSLLPYIEASSHLLVIDAADLDGPPGTVHLFEDEQMDSFLLGTRRRTVHEVGIIDLMDMARLRDCLPPHRALLCLKPGRIDWGEMLSLAVCQAMPGAAQLARGLLERWSSAGVSNAASARART